MVEIDESRLRQVLFNITTNAIKASPIGTEILLTTQISARVLRIAIDDDGPGASLKNVRECSTALSAWASLNGSWFRPWSYDFAQHRPIARRAHLGRIEPNAEGSLDSGRASACR